MSIQTIETIRQRLLRRATRAESQAETAENDEQVSTLLTVAETFREAARVCVRVIRGEVEPGEGEGGRVDDEPESTSR